MAFPQHNSLKKKMLDGSRMPKLNKKIDYIEFLLILKMCDKYLQVRLKRFVFCVASIQSHSARSATMTNQCLRFSALYLTGIFSSSRIHSMLVGL